MLETFNKHKSTAALMAAFFVATAAGAQKRTGDFFGAQSLNDSKRGTPRTMQYHPDGRDFVCVNGKNLYTRALYGGPADYRVETSDRPIFAIYKKRNCRNVRFSAVCGGRELPLEEAAWCEARYSDASRRYVVKDESWGGGTLYISAVALFDREGAVWQFRAEGFDKPLTLKATVGNIANPKLHRNGDLGVDPPGSFAPAPSGKPLSVTEWNAAGETYFAIDGTQPAGEGFDAAAHFSKAAEEGRQLASRIEFNTPDPYVNTLGGALTVAADGAWDGQTWLHGCVGWRMPLAGWRAGYLGDVLGWPDRAVSHFDAYASSQVTGVQPTIPHPSQDSALNLARAEKKWGTQMYSNGYICRNPGRNDQMHHYDMNLNYIDELLWHFAYDADTAYMRKMWPTIKLHLEWEKRNFDPDGDALYDAYCCIWASDALYYNGGSATHSSAYNYRANSLAALIAEAIGEDPAPYRAEAGRILKAMDSRMWLADKGHWAEYEDRMGLGRKHESAALWSIYTPIDCGAGTPAQFFRATRYVDREIPHIPVVADGKLYGSTISTSNWMPYSWSINNVAPAEVMHTALAYFEAGRSEAAFMLLKANIMDQMYLGDSPANFGQLSFYDAARGECYRDFSDCTGISARTLVQGLFGIVPDALRGRCYVRPGFPQSWDSASVRTPYFDYSFRREGDSLVYDITQRFARPLQIIVRQNTGGGQYRDIAGTADHHQVIKTTIPAMLIEPAIDESAPRQVDPVEYGLAAPDTTGRFTTVDIDRHFNANADDIFRNRYLSPRPPYTTLQLPAQGIGEWCHPDMTAEVCDSAFRTLASGGEVKVAGVPFRTPANGQNIAYTSLWDNYPDSITIPLGGHAASAYLLMAGSTNHMQSRIENALVVAAYADGTADTLRLVNPDNWCPIEQDYFVDGMAFHTTAPRPIRIAFGTGTVSRDLGREFCMDEVYGRPIPGGAAQMLRMPLDAAKELRSLTLRTLSNDVVVGLMAVTLQ